MDREEDSCSLDWYYRFLCVKCGVVMFLRKGIEFFLVHTGTPRRVALFTERRSVAALCRASLLVPFLQQHLLTVSHFGDSGNVSEFFIIFMVILIGDLWCYYYKKIMIC